MTIASPFRAVNSEELTVTNAVKRLTVATRRARPLAELVEIFVRTSPIMWLADGTDPSATVGNFHTPTMPPIELKNRSEIEEFRAFRFGNTDASISVTYKRP